MIGASLVAGSGYVGQLHVPTKTTARARRAAKWEEPMLSLLDTFSRPGRAETPIRALG